MCVSVLRISLALHYFITSKIFPVLESTEITLHASSLQNNSSLFHTPHPATLSHSAPLSVFILASKHLLKRCIWRTKVTNLLKRGFLSCTSHFHCDLCFPPTLSLFVLWKKSIKLSSIHIAANLILLLEISSAIRRHLSPLLALLEWPARLRGWGKGS